MRLSLRKCGLFFFVGSVIGAFVGSSIGIASNGSAQNGWVIIGIIGGTFGLSSYIILAQYMRPSLLRSSVFERKIVQTNVNEYRNLQDIGRALGRYLNGYQDLEREVRFYEFMIKNDGVVRNFSLVELNEEIGGIMSIAEIRRAIALADRMSRS